MQLPTTMSSPTRPVLLNKTNADAHGERDLIYSTLVSSSERKRLLSETTDGVSVRKRVKVHTEDIFRVDEEKEEEEDSSDEEDAFVVPRKPRNLTTFEILNARRTAGPSRVSRLPSYSTRSILQSFVSSNRSDVFNLHSMSNASYMSPPYACSYSHGSKRGEDSLLAVATEEGVVHIFNTSKRQEHDVEPQRCTFQPHTNGVFDVQWSPSDTQLATVSADHSLCITNVSRAGVTPISQMKHHKNTVKCVTWDPTRDGNVFCSGSRDGMICVWDVRAEVGCWGPKPVMVVAKAHETGKKTISRKGKMTAPPARGVTSLLFSGHNRYGLVSSGSYDGILRKWDLRYLDTRRRSTPQGCNIRSISSPVEMSSEDPTLSRGTRRARGITSMTSGTGITAGLLFALSSDSRIHTYDATTLEPLSGWTTDTNTDAWSYGYENMRTNSFYVRLAMSPCGQWLASGGARDGRAYVFDVSSSDRARVQPSLYGDMRGRGIELSGQKGEVGAVDWAPGQLATCADDGTVRIWRPDLETCRKCEAEPDEMAWSWSWAREQQR
ncbi:WD40-repeat-containing domain protein [Cytidiella melzeri]|nr:WD40-repeat-containing domain protein [Cytidiella melzeri]